MPLSFWAIVPCAIIANWNQVPSMKIINTAQKNLSTCSIVRSKGPILIVRASRARCLCFHVPYSKPIQLTCQAKNSLTGKIFSLIIHCMKILSKTTLLTPGEAAKIKGVTRQAIYAAMESGRLSYVKVKKIHHRITLEALDMLKINPNMQRKA